MPGMAKATRYRNWVPRPSLLSPMAVPPLLVVTKQGEHVMLPP